MTMNTLAKPQYKSLTIIGAVLTIVSSLGLFGLSYNPATYTISIDLRDVFDAALAAAIPGGGVIAWWGRLIAKRPVAGLW